MLRRVMFASIVLATFLSRQSAAQTQVPQPTIGRVVKQNDALDQLISEDAQIEVLAMGLDWAEGPVWVPRDGGFLLFSDVPRNTVYKWHVSEGLSVFLHPSGYTGLHGYSREPGSNGLILDSRGRLICCEHGDRRVSAMEWDHGKITLADKWDGKRLNSPNDAVLHPNGDIYFTDPPYGLPQREADLDSGYGFCGVFRITPGGAISLVTGEMTRPNGIGFSPDGRTLYVAQSDGEAPIIRAFELKEDNSIGAGRVFYDASDLFGKLPGAPDGMAIDAAGNLFATGPGGVHVISPEGKLLGRIETGVATANCCWGDDGTVLYMTADMYLCRIQTKTKGLGDWK